MPPRALPRLHLVTDERVLRSAGFLETAERLLDRGGGRVALHLRGHELSGRERWEMAATLSRLTRSSGAALNVNDRVDVAVGCGAEGVQLGRGSLPPAAARELLGDDRWIGASVHDPQEAAEAARQGADFLLAGTLYASPSHPGGEPSGIDWIRDLAPLGLPVLGIGGIDATRLPEVLDAGAYGVAAISAVWSAPDPVGSLEQFLHHLE